VWIATNIRDTNKRFSQTPGTVDIAPSILRYMRINPVQNTVEEMDGVPFIGPVSVSDLKATRDGTVIRLTWKVVDPAGDATIKISTTNDFMSGGKDSYRVAGTVPVSIGKYDLEVGQTNSCFYKIVVQAPANTLNVWVTHHQEN
jgi:hypothetical protein